MFLAVCRPSGGSLGVFLVVTGRAQELEVLQHVAFIIEIKGHDVIDVVDPVEAFSARGAVCALRCIKRVDIRLGICPREFDATLVSAPYEG